MLNELLELKEQGLITLRPNDSNTLLIANYTPKVQYERLWTETLKRCRGLIIDNEGNIVARPFPKFFNIEEHDVSEIPNESFEVYDKLDGSLGIMFYHADKWQIATRGSFNSDQSVKANELLNTKYVGYLDFFNKDITYLFEIIYPENRVVCDYGKDELLIMLGGINKHNGFDYDVSSHIFPEKVTRYNGVNSVDEIKALEDNSKEGVVLKFKSGLRVKCKFPEYVRLHRIITQVSSKSIWEYLSEGLHLTDLLERVPDEFYKWVKQTVFTLNKSHLEIQQQAKSDFITGDNSDRKQFAEYAKTTKYPSLLFALYDGKDINPIIWKMIKPIHEKPFKTEI